MSVTDLMERMRSEGISEEDIAKAVTSHPQLLEQYRAEKQEALLSRKLPGGMEDLAGQAKVMANQEARPQASLNPFNKNHRWFVGMGDDAENLKAGAKGAFDAAGREASGASFGLSNRALHAAGVDTSGQEDFPRPLGVAMDIAGGVINPVNRALGAGASKLGGALASRLPQASGFAPGAARFLGNVGIGAGTNAAAAAASQGVQEGMDGGQPGAGGRMLAAGAGGAVLGAGGSVLEQMAHGLQNTKGVRARQYAKVGEEEAKRIVAAGPPPVGDPGYRRFAEAQDIVNMPQGGKSARLGMDLENEARHPGVAEAYRAADAQARGREPVVGADGEPNPMRTQPRMVDVTGLASELRGISPDGRAAMRSPEVEAQMAKYSALMQRFGATPGPDGQVFMPADRVNELKKIIGAKGAYENMPGVSRSDFAAADAHARAANAQYYGEADRMKMLQEIDRERSRAAMGLRDEPSVAREQSDANRLQSYMQPQLHGGHYGITGNITANLQAVSGLGPVQSLARGAQGLGAAASNPQMNATVWQQILDGHKKAHEARVIDVIFGKKPNDKSQENQP